jgi:hypothetical protein
MSYTGLDKEASYRVRLVYIKGGDAGKSTFRLTATGGDGLTALVHGPLAVNATAAFEFAVPQSATRGGKVQLDCHGPRGTGGMGRCCQISEVWLLKMVDSPPTLRQPKTDDDDVASSQRRRVSLDFGWRFHLGDPQGATNQSVAAPDYDDSAWRETDTPHDFVIEGNFTKGPVKVEGNGDLAHGYLPSGVGWYRRNFTWPSAEQHGWLTFDAIFRQSDVFVNGVHLTHHRSGYTGVEVGLGGVAIAGENVLAVRCDASVGEGWFYEVRSIYLFHKQT